ARPYMFPGYIPDDPVYIYCRRWDNGFARYSKAAHDALLPTHGWYCLSSPKEMLAEIYTNYYSGRQLPPPVNGKEPRDFFQALEASEDSGETPPFDNERIVLFSEGIHPRPPRNDDMIPILPID